MMEELHQFLLVADQGTFTAAARHAHLSQPALTAAIKRLEATMGARLFDRDRRGARLTRAGEALIPRARAAIGAIEEGRRAIEELEGLQAGEVRIGAGSTACTHFLPSFVAGFRKHHPGIRFVLREVVPDVALDLLAQNEIDLAIVTGPRGERWREDPLVLVASPEIDPVNAPFIAFMRGANTRALLDKTFPQADIMMELGSIEGVLGHVRAGTGIALVSRAAAEHDLAAGRVVEIPDRRTPITRVLRIVHRGQDRLPPSAAAFREVLLGKKVRPKPTIRR